MTANAGTLSEDSKTQIAPSPQPCLLSWFAGGSVGYLTQLEEPMYSILFGVDPCWTIGGGRITMFAQVGYANRDKSYSPSGTFIPLPGTIIPQNSFDLDDLEGALKDSADTGLLRTSYDLDIVPITLNAQYERQIYGALSGYAGAGVGVAWVDLDADAGSFGSFHKSDWVFTGQLFAGLNYRFTPQLEAYGGVRWMYFQDADLGGGTFKMDDDFLIELGARFRF
jgi:opacity protein-like surface antigen